jgi:hypothetical protein
LYKVAWIFQYLSQLIFEKYSSIKNYKDIEIPLYIFHSKNNQKVPLIESIILYRHLKGKCKFIPIYGHEEMILCSKENRQLIMKELSGIF